MCVCAQTVKSIKLTEAIPAMRMEELHGVQPFLKLVKNLSHHLSNNDNDHGKSTTSAEMAVK